jgi:2-oxoglutarate ferredoxin oxidoreductase subunit beta
MKPEVVDATKFAPDDLLFHDEKADEPTLAFLLARMRRPEFPEPVGVLRAIERPTYDELANSQIKDAIAKFGPGDLDKLYNSGDTWVVE